MKFPSDYIKRKDTIYWQPRSSTPSFGYSDGTEHEQYLKQCLTETDDLSVFSKQLVEKIKDWPSQYHLSQKRANLLRPLKLNKKHTVLELGAGCGAITRYLGETVSRVVAVEGSDKRAELAALRCRDLDNVDIVCSNFEEITFDTKFKVVTLIGVLEYSGVFIQGDNPYQAALDLAKKYLADDGVLVVAIENKLGLKYFDGCIEEHTNIPFKGIEGYDSNSRVATFGKAELKRLLQKSGLKHTQFLYPFPDYKLPNGIMQLDAKVGSRKPFFYQWFSFDGSTDYGHMRSNGFNEYLVSKELENNGLLADFSNSFLVLSSPNATAIESIFDAKKLIEKYNVERQQRYMTKISLLKERGNKFAVEKNRLHPALSKTQSTGSIKQEKNLSSTFIDGYLLMEDIIRASRESITAMIVPLQEWKGFLEQAAQSDHLPSNYHDCTPWNLIRTEKTNELKYFDNEWIDPDPIPMQLILLRGLFSIYHWLYRRARIELSTVLPDLTLRDFCEHILMHLNTPLTQAQWEQALKKEWQFQTEVSLKSIGSFKTYKEQLAVFPKPFYSSDLNPLYTNESKPLFEHIDKLGHSNYQLRHKINNANSRLDTSESQLRLALMENHNIKLSPIWKIQRVLSKIKRVLLSEQNLQFINRVNSRISRWRKIQQEIGWLLFIEKSPVAIMRRMPQIKLRLFHYVFQQTAWGKWIYSLFNIPLSDDTHYNWWLFHHYPTRFRLWKFNLELKKFGYRPTISVILPVYNPPIDFLREAIDSVINQNYPDWQLCIADDASTNSEIQTLLQQYANKDSRIKVTFHKKNQHICHASNSAFDLATGEFIALLDHDDLLNRDALFQVVKLLNKNPQADMIYSDEDKIDQNKQLVAPFFKPDWCPDSFLTRMYTCHLGVYRKSLVEEIGKFRPGFEGAQDYDLVLRLTEKTDQIFHIDQVLYHWRIHESSTAMTGVENKPYAYDAAQKALSEALQRRGEAGTVSRIADFLGNYQVRYEITKPGLVSIIIPTRDHAQILDQCLTSIFEKTTYKNFEVIVIDNGSVEEETKTLFNHWAKKQPKRFRCLPLDIPFNYSKLNNFAVSQSQAEYLLFLNNDTEVINEDWIEGMVEQAQRDSIGAVGALLFYPDGSIQHAGVIVGLGGAAAHSHRCGSIEKPGYFGQVWTANNYSAVTAACLMCRRSVFDEVNGFEEQLDANFNDVDFCLKLVEAGYRNIYLPHVKLYHHESKSRGKEMTPARQEKLAQEIGFLASKWRKYIDHDPCYNRHLTRESEDYQINKNFDRG